MFLAVFHTPSIPTRNIVPSSHPRRHVVLLCVGGSASSRSPSPTALSRKGTAATAVSKAASPVNAAAGRSAASGLKASASARSVKPGASARSLPPSEASAASGGGSAVTSPKRGGLLSSFRGRSASPLKPQGSQAALTASGDAAGASGGGGGGGGAAAVAEAPPAAPAGVEGVNGPDKLAPDCAVVAWFAVAKDGLAAVVREVTKRVPSYIRKASGC